MEMAPMMAQPQDITALVSGTTAAGNGPLSPRTASAPLLFATLMQEMQPPLPITVDAVLIPVNQAVTGKGLLSGKAKAGVNPAPAPGDGKAVTSGQITDQDLSPLAQLLAMAGRIPVEQSPPRPTGAVEGQSPETGEEESAGSNGDPKLPMPGIDGGPVQGPGPENTAVPYLNGLTPVGTNAVPAQMPVEAGGSRPVNGRLVILDSERGAVPGLPVFTQPRQDASAGILPTGLVVEAEKSADQTVSPQNSTHQLQGRTADAGVSDNPAQPQPQPSLQPQPGPGSDLPAFRQDILTAGRAVEPARLADVEIPLEPGSDRDRSSQPSYDGVKVQLPPTASVPFTVIKPAAAAQSAGGPAQAPAAGSSPERPSGLAESVRSASGTVQPQAKSATAAPFSAKKTAVVLPQGETAPVPTETPAGHIAAKVNHDSTYGPGTALLEVRDVLPSPEVVAGAGSPVSLPVDIVVSAPSTSDSPSGRNEDSRNGAKEKEQEGTTAFGVAAAHSSDLPGSNRFTLQPKTEEPRSALHESILTQVKTSVVNHDGKGNGTMTVRLNPEQLGDLQVNVRVENQRVKVEIITDNRTVRDALMGNLDHLKETFLKQNLNMERFDVSSGGGNGFGQGFREERGDQRHISAPPYGHEAAPLDTLRENGEDDWGMTENSLVNLRL